MVNYLMISIFSFTIKLYSFEVFASLSLNKGLVIFDTSKNILFLHEVDLSTLLKEYKRELYTRTNKTMIY